MNSVLIGPVASDLISAAGPIDPNQEYWAYGNPIRHSYVVTAMDPVCLSLFESEAVGRAVEQMSPLLQTRVGHYITGAEALEIASKSRARGRILLITAEDLVDDARLRAYFS